MDSAVMFSYVYFDKNGDHSYQAAEIHMYSGYFTAPAVWRVQEPLLDAPLDTHRAYGTDISVVF